MRYNSYKWVAMLMGLIDTPFIVTYNMKDSFFQSIRFRHGGIPI